jgi:hypothetical protein
MLRRMICQAQNLQNKGELLHGIGFNPKAGKQISEMLEVAGGLKHSASRNVIARLGKGASEELQKAAVVELEGLVDAMAGVLRGMPDPPMPADEFAKLSPLVLEEARTKGVEMPWFATWGQRV